MPDAPVDVRPVAANAWLIMVELAMIAVVPAPADRIVAIIVNLPVSTAAVPAPNVIVLMDGSAVVPAVPKRTLTMGVAVPAPVLTISNSQMYWIPATVMPDGKRIEDPANNVSVAKPAETVDAELLNSTGGVELA